MLTPAVINIISYFYPLGNTPAVCLTQDLPPEQNANVLLLGCGDARNILFTTYCVDGIRDRRLDITCCDVEVAILARNILLYTLLLDDVEGSNDRYIWNIYYHLYLDKLSFKLVQAQLEKIYALSTSLRSWHDCKYGKILRFCDQGTFNKVKDSWKSWGTIPANENENHTYKKCFKSAIEKGVDAKVAQVGPQGVVLTGVRSAAPLSVRAFKDIPKLYQYFWDHGDTPGSDGLSKTKQPNPMFASLVTDAFTLHYGTDPLLGFHLATAYAPLIQGSPLRSDTIGSSRLHEVVEGARTQFRAWSVSFRKSVRQGLFLRFFSGDALAFCHTLQHKQAAGDANSAYWYRSPWTLEPLVLDTEDYETTGDAPLSFNVIDTSNLVDHLNAINVLVATSPLLDGSISATLYTENLVRREERHKSLLENFLCGHLLTISVILGLFPLEYWTNATAISTGDEAILDMSSSSSKGKSGTGQMHCRLAWKRPLSAPVDTSHSMIFSNIHFDEAELAGIFYQMYLKMFQHEDLSFLMSKINPLSVRNLSLPRYHRGTLASFLLLAKKRITANWKKTMEVFLDLVEGNSTLIVGSNYIQEFYLQLHLFGVYSAPTFWPNFNHITNTSKSKDLRAWKDVPATVCITLEVPRARLRVMTDLPHRELGTPIVHCTLQSSRAFAGQAWSNIFAIVQLAFGKVSTVGSRDNEDFKFSITEDRNGWKGKSSLFVSFCAPTWVVLLEPENATTNFGLQNTPHAMNTFLKTLGLEMSIFTTTLGNKNNVYITKYRPNQSGFARVSNFAVTEPKTQASCNDPACATITAKVDQKTARITAFLGHVDIYSEDIKSVFAGGASVEVVQVSPCIVAIVIGRTVFRHNLHFPAPVLKSQSTCRIARKSSYVEFVVPIAQDLDRETFPHFMYPLFLDGHKPVVWNMPYLDLERLPILDTTKTKELNWLVVHTSLMFSAREREMRARAMSSSSEIQEDVRINFKDSLFSMFMNVSGLQGHGARVFGVSNPDAGGVHMLVFVSCLRLDIVNHTVVLDAAILPLTERLVLQIRTFLKAIMDTKMVTIKVDQDELELWKEVIPAWVERCRLWEHRSACEYSVKSCIPLTTENGQIPICSCGNGKLPNNFMTGLPKWNMVSKHAVRAAISPSFSVPFVEQVGLFDSRSELGSAGDDRCMACGKEKSNQGTKLLTCARCHVAKYCSAGCQRADWKKHKLVCGNW